MITFLGNIFLDRACSLNQPIAHYICNLAYPISNKIPKTNNTEVLRQDGSVLKKTFGSYPLALGLTNNLMKYGEDGLEDTINYCKAHSIYYLGAGNAENNYSNPIIFFTNKLSIAIAGYCRPSSEGIPVSSGKNSRAELPIATILSQIEIIKSMFDRLIVLQHWGNTGASSPKSSDIEFAHAMIDNGADLIIGQHSEHLQPYELYKNKYIFYGIGDWITYDRRIKSSIGVTYDPTHETVKIFRMTFNNGRLIHTSPAHAAHRIKVYLFQKHKKIPRAHIIYKKCKDHCTDTTVCSEIPGSESGNHVRRRRYEPQLTRSNLQEQVQTKIIPVNQA